MAPQLTPAERGRIVGMLESGRSVKAIAREMGVCPKTVRKWRDRFNERNNVERKEGSGRPRSTTPETNEIIYEESQGLDGDTFYTARQLANRLGLNISPRTVVRILKEMGIHSRRAAKKEYISMYHRFVRLQYATRLGDLPALSYARVIFSDEKVSLPTMCTCLFTFR